MLTCFLALIQVVSHRLRPQNLTFILCPEFYVQLPALGIMYTVFISYEVAQDMKIIV